MNNTRSSRAKLHEQLLEVAENVYFQAPPQMKYPCIMYDVSRIKKHNANNKRYLTNVGYKLTVIDKDPESEIFEKLLDMPMCKFDTQYKADGLYHFVFTIYI